MGANQSGRIDKTFYGEEGKGNLNCSFKAMYIQINIILFSLCIHVVFVEYNFKSKYGF